MKLDDTQRKVLRILYNLYERNWARPSLAELSRLSRRSPDRVRAAVKALRDGGYVEIKQGALRVLRPFETESVKPESDLRIWME